MGRLPASGVAGLLIEKVKDPETGEVTERYAIDLKFKNSDGLPDRYRQRLPSGISRAAAKKKAQRVSNSAEAGKLITVQQKTLSQGFAWYLETWVPANCPASARSKKTQTDALLRVLGQDIKLDELSPFGLERFKAVYKKEIMAKREEGSFDEKTVGAASINRALTTIKHAAGRWLDNSWMRAATFEAIRKVKKVKEPPGRTRSLTVHEEARVIAELAPGMKGILRAVTLTGFRREEIASLRREYINMQSREITLPRTKSGKERSVPINDSLKQLLDEILDGAPVSEYVFLSERGKRFACDSISRAFSRAAKKAGVTGVRFHDGRHTNMTRMRRRGVQLDVLQELGGWASLAMVQRYAHIGKEEKHAAAKLLDEPIRISQYSGPETGSSTKNQQEKPKLVATVARLL